MHENWHIEKLSKHSKLKKRGGLNKYPKYNEQKTKKNRRKDCLSQAPLAKHHPQARDWNLYALVLCMI
jgi:hypothetical protein